MKKYLLLLFPFFLISCRSLREMPLENKQVVINITDGQELVITETYSHEKELTASIDEPAIAEMQNDPEIKQHVFSSEKDLQPVLKDTIRTQPLNVSEAINSERVARNAHIWSFIPLTGLLGFLGIIFDALYFTTWALPPIWILSFAGFLLGIIVTLILLNKVKKFAYVTPKTLETQRRARITLAFTAIGVFAVYVLTVVVAIFSLLIIF